MAAHLRSVVPSSSPVPRLHPPGFSCSRTQRVPHNKTPCVFSFSPHGSTGKLLHTLSAYSYSSSTIATDSYDAPELLKNAELSQDVGNGGGSLDGHGGRGGGGGGGDGSDDVYGGGHGHGDSGGKGGFLGALLKGWNERVSADPQFPFKVLMEEIVGVGACVIGDMASRPNFGLNELDFVFSTIVVGSILNFALMYMLAPTSAVAASATNRLPFIFSSCPPGHMFEHGAYSVLDRLGTFVYKGAVFAAVGFGAGLFGTFISNLLIGMRKKMDPSFEPQNKAPPTVLNAATWALHMGLSSNLRYQLINGLEFAMANVLSPPVFKVSVFGIRAMNNVVGGVSFVTLARLTGSQKADVASVPSSTTEEKEPNLSTTDSTAIDKLATTDAGKPKDAGINPEREDDASP